MKVINRKNGPVTEEELIKACQREERRAQKLLYDRFAPRMMGVCRRYVKTAEDAEDVLIEAFFKVLLKILSVWNVNSKRQFNKVIVFSRCQD